MRRNQDDNRQSKKKTEQRVQNHITHKKIRTQTIERQTEKNKTESKIRSSSVFENRLRHAFIFVFCLYFFFSANVYVFTR